MKYKIGDVVTRKSHHHDMTFEIIQIHEEICYLKGVNIRLVADSPMEDLVLYNQEKDIEQEQDFLKRASFTCTLNRDDYFYLPGKILHIDADEDYLKRCLDYYHQASLEAIGVILSEQEVPLQITSLLEQYHPSIVVITGHDAYYKNAEINQQYKNSPYFIEAVKEARKIENSHQKLTIIAGACQSDYEALIKAGATFASSPKRINIHALDPAIIATKLSLTCTTESINLKELLEKTKYGAGGMGGLQTTGLMYVGYPR